ncbi:MAG: hypothetical protein WD276_00815 [Actinomycetota bacterium]
MPAILAHEAWFTDARPGYDWGFAADPASLVFIVAAVAIALVWRFAARLMPTPELGFLRPLGRLSPWIPRLLAIHAGVSLLAQSTRGTYLAPSLDLPSNEFGTTLAIVEGVTGVWLITGFRIRAAALLLILAGPVGMIAYGIVPILERIDLLGIALFIAILPPEETPGGAVHAPKEVVARALFALRVLVGLSLIVLALTEKLARPDLALAFLDRYPFFNVLSGLGVSAEEFIRFAGAIELLFGLLILSGSMPQFAVIAAGIPFNATLFFLGASELIGHLPIYGAMLALLVYGSDPKIAPLVPGFPRLRIPVAAKAGGPVENR